MDEAADGILIADADGIARFWNPGAVRIFGFTLQEAAGQSLDIIIPAALRGRHWHGYAESIRTGQTHYGAGALLVVPALRKDGVRISIDFSIAPFRDATGRVALTDPPPRPRVGAVNGRCTAAHGLALRALIETESETMVCGSRSRTASRCAPSSRRSFSSSHW